MPREMPDFSKMDPNKMAAATDPVGALSGDHIKKTMNMMWQSMKKGGKPTDMLDISEDTVEYFYAQAYQFYNQGKYKEALYLFQMLTMLEPGVSRHGLGSAACLHRMGKYEAAGQLYIISQPMDPENPLPFFHASDCYIKLKVYELAEFNLQKCLDLCKDKEEFKLVKERSSMMLEACLAQIARDDKELEEKERAEKESGASATEEPDSENS